jgi:hypothetical protein
MLGVALGEYFYGRCTGHQTFMSRKFIAAGIDAAADTTDFNPFSPDQKDLDQAPGVGKFYSYQAGGSITKSDLMKYVWHKAREEWKGRFGVQ